MNIGGGSDGYMSDINVTPFVDVMLVLLIIFMVTAPMMMQGLDVTLPQVTAKPLESKPEHLVITVDKTGQTFINDFQVTLDTLRDKLAKILEGRPEAEVFIKADKDIPYGTVVEVMGAIKDAGVENVGMVTTPADVEPGEREAKSKR